MNEEHDTIIGLEVHVQLNTKSKLFCGCPTKATEPNTAVCQVCLGHPGSKPVLNQKALEYGIKLALALDCELSPSITFSRKTYFYPDMSKNFQITQYEIPLGKNGKLTLDSGKQITISRIHLEEDPASLVHEPGYVLVDYNRSGIPLCEIVTAPELNSPEEAREFMNKLLAILSYLGIFDPEGVIKADVNVSIKETGFTRVEIKNITGFKEIERALYYEVSRQKAHEVIRETRGWDAEKGITIPMRAKEFEEDYGYIIEPDLPIFTLEPALITRLKAEIPELPQEKAARYVKEYKIDPVDARIIASNLSIAKLFEEVITRIDPVLASHWFRKELLRMLNLRGKTLDQTKVTTARLVELLTLLKEKTITPKIGRQIMDLMAEQELSPKAYVQTLGLEKISDRETLATVCDEVLKEHAKAVADYKAGQAKALQFLIGQVARKTKGKCDPAIVKEILEEKLEQR